MTSIVRNQWYVAAYGREVGREVFGRTICGESILFWRREDGTVTAMSDRCVHRRFPLSRSPPTWSATRSSAGTTASPTTRTASASPSPARPGCPAPRG